MGTVEGLMSFATNERGNRYKKELPLYTAAVTFTYAVWESYAEDLAIEMTELLASKLEPDDVPESIRKEIEKRATTWELAVSPRWQRLWVRMVTERAKGGTGAAPFGLNTASKVKVSKLFELVGIDPVPDLIEAPEESGSHSSPSLPSSVVVADGNVDVGQTLDGLIRLRGQAVHGVATEKPLYKHQVLWWQRFVESLISTTDRQAQIDVENLKS